MDFGAVLTAGANASTHSQPSGVVFVIRCEPDPFAGERLNVGVFGIDQRGRRRTKVIESVGRLECLYGDAADSVLWLARAASEAALAGVDAPSPQLSFDGPMPYFHSSLEEAVEGAFAELVTVALPPREQRQSEPKLSDEEALRQVSDFVKQMIGLNFDVLANTPDVVLNTERGPWKVRIPLQPKGGAGTVRSAAYGAAVLKSHLIDSVLDLECAARYRNTHRLGLFLLRPPRRSDDAEAPIDAVIDSVMHRAPRALRFEVASTAEELAFGVCKWAQQAE